jgi:ribosomal-protein-serine acetyltransferase
VFPFDIDEEFSIALFEIQHAEVLTKVVESNRGHLGYWVPWTWESDLNNILDYISRGVERFGGGTGFEAGIWAGNELAGGIGLYPRHLNIGTFELEYWLAFAFEGRGVMTRSLATTCEVLFSVFGCLRLEVHCELTNYRSRAVARRLGFREECPRVVTDRPRKGFPARVVYSLGHTES